MNEIHETAQQILNCCRKENIEKVYCCITRLRLCFKDKAAVDYEGLSQNKLVKGIYWYGEECQLLIGLEAIAISETMNYLMARR